MKKDIFLHSSDGSVNAAGGSPAQRAIRSMQLCAGLLFALAFTCIAQDARPAIEGAGSQDASAAAQAKQQPAATAETPRKKLISDESTQLLAMAVALKSEVDKTNKDMLSLGVIRKANEIERMARTVREKMKTGSGPG